jgi:8-oxo-dGTP pyrophosphatase MutT (NUDIX family)
MTSDNPWVKLSSRLVYENPWIKVREDQVISPRGASGIYGVVETRVATGIVALSDEQRVWLVGQYRYPIEEYSWEIPEGGSEEGEDPLAAAQRELKEETGISAARWEPLGGEVHVSNCFSSERGRIFLAQDLSFGDSQPDHTELLQVRSVSLRDALMMVDDGAIKDSLSIIAILRVTRRLEREGIALR